MATRRFSFGCSIAAACLCWGMAAPVLAEAYARAPIAQYRLAKADEVALARSAAPPAISGNATVLALGETGYEVAAQGKNGFTCIVERSWASGFDDPEFWNPKIRAPICFNAAATRSVLPEYLERTKWVLAGATEAQILEHAKAAVASGAVGAPAVGAMCYMMSKQQYLSDKAGGHWHPHLMYFLPKTDDAAWGANLPGSPMIAAQGDPEPVTVFFAPVPRWSDGTMGSMEM